MKTTALAVSLALALGTLAQPALAAPSGKPFLWENATVYFLLTDRFNNANKANDLAYGRKADGAPMRGYMGGDLAGVTKKIEEGYFTKLGVNAIWITPPVEQIHAGTDEGTGKSYGFHGYPMASTATGPRTSPRSTPTLAPRPTFKNWLTPRTRTASACCSMWS
jgi:alpha-amylase